MNAHKQQDPSKPSPWPFIIWLVITIGGLYLVRAFWPSWLDTFLFGDMILLIFGGIVQTFWPAIVRGFQGRDDDEK